MIAPVLIWLAPLTFTHHVILQIKLLYIIADSEEEFNGFFLYIFKYGYSLTIVYYQCGP